VFGGRLKDVREEIQPEYFFFLLLGTLGLTMLVSCVELITLFVRWSVVVRPVPAGAAAPGAPRPAHPDGVAAKYVMFAVVSTGFCCSA